MDTADFIVMPIPMKNYAAVCALIGVLHGVALPLPEGNGSGLTAADMGQPQAVNAKRGTGKSSAGDETPAAESPASAGTGETATSNASPSEENGEVDAHGHPWSPDLHASTKNKTKDGLWRMKVGVTRPDPKPGFPKSEESSASSPPTGTSSETNASSATSPDATAQESAPTATSAGEDDEFAAFRAAAAASDATDEAAAASVPARSYSDADLGALCNQAAVKLGDPTPVKAIIANYTPEGQVAHSRNVPEDQRAAFVAEVEAKAGIQFAG